MIPQRMTLSHVCQTQPPLALPAKWGEQTKEWRDSNLGANLSIATLPLLPLDKTQQKLRGVTHIGHYARMCASVATHMCGLPNPILCRLFLLQVNYIYMY